MKRKMKLAGNQDNETSSTINPSPNTDDPTLLATDSPVTPQDPDEMVRSKLDHPQQQQDAVSEMETGGDEVSTEEPHTKPASRSRLKFCNNCGQEILTKILVCAGCKKVAYCNFRCQKASWKVHKKTCSYALRKDNKESTG